MEEETIYSAEHNRLQEPTLQNMALLLALLFKVFVCLVHSEDCWVPILGIAPRHCDMGKKAKAQDKSPREKLGVLGYDLLRPTSEA